MKTSPMSSISPSFLAIQKELNDKYGDVLRRGTDKGEKHKLPTGVFNIDWCLRGGLPANRLTLICGHKGCYKTTLALRAIVSWQNRCPFCFNLKGSCSCGGLFAFGEEKVINSDEMVAVFIDSEHALDLGHAARLGVNLERLLVFDPPHGEAACEYAEKFARVPEVALIIEDSLASLVPEQDLEKGYFDGLSQSLRSRLIARMYRALTTHLSRPGYPPRIAIALNHLLPNRNHPGDILPGGETQKYLSSVVLKLWVTRKQYITLTRKGEEKIEEEEGQKPQAPEDDAKVRKQSVGFLVEHSKVSPDLMKGEFEIYLGEEQGINFGDTDDFSAVYYRASKLGLTDGARRGDLKKLWQEDKLAYERIKKQIIELA